MKNLWSNVNGLLRQAKTKLERKYYEKKTNMHYINNDCSDYFWI